MATKKNILIFLTSRYPYKPGEEFIETEIKFVSKEFDEIVIIPTSSFDESSVRDVPQNVYVHKNPKTSSRVKRTFEVLRNKQSMNWLLNESRSAIKFGMKGFLNLINWLGYANHIKKEIEEVVGGLDSEGSKIYIYSYWLTPSAVAAAMMKETNPNLIAVSRTHGGDLYDYRHSPPYLPLKMRVINTLNRVYTISKDGYEYLSNQNPNIANKLVVSRLGTSASKGFSKQSTDSVLRIVTCSYLKPVKRIGLLVSALSECSIPIEWTHIGDGELRNEIETKTKLLSSNKMVRFLGNLPNEEVRRVYENGTFDLFLNVSESEGIPVTIMEAFSCGIPVMATDVGGTSELVNAQNGVLLPKNIDPVELTIEIEKYALLSDDEKKAKIRNAIETWDTTYNAERNYTDFAQATKKIGELNTYANTGE
ncbi:glycosyltransferase [Bacillus sp. JJ1521]|uniref:glycosyltransferase n=1 Tax=Bacillus sp. JJ1521 TaxID=3122957 RepID=UPI003000DA8D